ncbi:hypothetical protein CJF32_00003470 [Rutstroemia sp. NJR-2017a WRK4]|nr:hypothetical protein CJF32_00003470 [Rutstroemia sp. NJR-2017a WRK4]
MAVQHVTTTLIRKSPGAKLQEIKASSFSIYADYQFLLRLFYAMSLVPLGPYVPPRARVLSQDDRYISGLPGRGAGPLLRNAFDNGFSPLGGSGIPFNPRHMNARGGRGPRHPYNEMLGQRGPPTQDANTLLAHFRRAHYPPEYDPDPLYHDSLHRHRSNVITVPSPHHDDYKCHCSDCDPIHRASLPSRCHHETRQHEHHHCCSKSSGSGSGDSSSNNKDKSNSSSSSKYSFPTKDIVIRGKTYACRKSFLADQPKFEDTLVKTTSAKKEDLIPTSVIESLFACINEERCPATNPHDLVTLNILASGLGIKSVVEKSLAQLKKSVADTIIQGAMLTQIVVTVMMSSKVDEGVKEWLKMYVKGWGLLEELEGWPDYRRAVDAHPEIHTGLYELLGFRKPVGDEGYRIL